MKDRAVGEFIDLGEGADVARAEEVGFGRVLALEEQRVSGFHALLVVVDVERGVLLDCALMDAEDADLADVRVIDDLEDLGDDGQILFRTRDERRAVGMDEESVVGFGRARKMADDDLHEVADADQVLRGDEADGDDRAFTQGLRDERVQGARVDAAFLEIVLEHFVVLLDDLFNEGAMDFTDAENVGFSFVLVEAVDDDGAVVGGKVDRENARTPDFLQVQKQLFEVDVGCVELVDHDHAAQTAFLGDVHHAARQKLDALGGVDDGADGLDGVKRGHVLTDVVGVPRGVEHVNAHGGEVGKSCVDVSDGQTDGVLDLLFKRVVVAHRVAALNGAEFGNHAGAVEHGFDEGSLAAGAVPHQRYGTKILGQIVAHCCSPLPEQFFERLVKPSAFQLCARGSGDRVL